MAIKKRKIQALKTVQCLKVVLKPLAFIYPIFILFIFLHFKCIFSWLLGASLPAPILNCMSAVRRQFSSLDSLTISICQFTLDWPFLFFTHQVIKGVRRSHTTGHLLLCWQQQGYMTNGYTEKREFCGIWHLKKISCIIIQRSIWIDLWIWF